MDIKTLFSGAIALLSVYAGLMVAMIVFLMQRYHMPLRTARHYTMLTLFSAPLCLGVLGIIVLAFKNLL